MGEEGEEGGEAEVGHLLARSWWWVDCPSFSGFGE